MKVGGTKREERRRKEREDERWGDGGVDSGRSREERGDVTLMWRCACLLPTVQLLRTHQIDFLGKWSVSVLHPQALLRERVLQPRHRFIRRSTSSQPPYARPASSPKKSLPCMRATRVKPPTPYSDSGSDSHSDSRSDSRSESSIQVVEKSNDAADSDNGSYIQLVEKGDDAADSDIEILERNEGAGGASPDPDVVELTSVPSSLASEETKRHLKYQRRYRLVLAPAVEDLTHDERAEVRFGFRARHFSCVPLICVQVVRKYFALAPRLADPKAQQVALFKRVSQNMCRNSTSITNEECSVSSRKCGLLPSGADYVS